MITLRDGSPVLIRQIRAADTPLVAGIFDRLSDASRWLQFLGTKKELSPRTAGAELVRCGHGTAEYEITLTPAAVGTR